MNKYFCDICKREMTYFLRRNIRNYLSCKHLTQKQFSDAAGINFRTLESILEGASKNPTLSNVIKIANAMNTTIDELISKEKHYE